MGGRSDGAQPGTDAARRSYVVPANGKRWRMLRRISAMTGGGTAFPISRAAGDRRDEEQKGQGHVRVCAGSCHDDGNPWMRAQVDSGRIAASPMHPASLGLGVYRDLLGRAPQVVLTVGAGLSEEKTAGSWAPRGRWKYKPNWGKMSLTVVSGASSRAASAGESASVEPRGTQTAKKRMRR